MLVVRGHFLQLTDFVGNRNVQFRIFMNCKKSGWYLATSHLSPPHETFCPRKFGRNYQNIRHHYALPVCGQLLIEIQWKDQIFRSQASGSPSRPYRSSVNNETDTRMDSDGARVGWCEEEVNHTYVLCETQSSNYTFSNMHNYILML